MVAAALREAGAHTRVHDDHFAPDARDETWLREVGRLGWIVLTKDQKIRYRPNELLVLKKFGVRAFVLTAGDLQGSEMGRAFVRALPAIHQAVGRYPAPFIAAVSKGGRVSLLS